MTHMVCVWFSQSSKTMIGSSKRDVFYFLLVTMTPPPRHVSSRPQREGPGTLWHWEIVKLIGVRGQCGTSIRGHERCTS